VSRRTSTLSRGETLPAAPIKCRARGPIRRPCTACRKKQERRFRPPLDAVTRASCRVVALPEQSAGRRSRYQTMPLPIGAFRRHIGPVNRYRVQAHAGRETVCRFGVWRLKTARIGAPQLGTNERRGYNSLGVEMSHSEFQEHSRLVRVAWESINAALDACRAGDPTEFKRLLDQANLHGIEALAITDEMRSNSTRERNNNPDSPSPRD
jgi:hypothetical protein